MSRLSFFARRYVSICTTVLGCVLLGPLAQAQELTVSAAASLADAFREIGRAFEATRPGAKLVFNFAASGPLLQQIAQGAPVDVFATADQETMDRAAARSLIASDSRAVFAANRVVLVVPAGASATPTSLRDLRNAAYKRVAVGNPASVPAGRYAREAIDAAGLSEALKDRLILADSVRQVLVYVGRAEVDAGFVYRTDALVDRERVRVALELPTRTPVTYPVAQVAASARPALARAFIAFLATPLAQAVLARHGFAKP
ncbi:MAG: Molybdate-binding protein ModA [Rhodocyclaceae bacterium]|nr:Molybdate-binding protein ModA [Rhodocyclaceae bacterium]